MTAQSNQSLDDSPNAVVPHRGLGAAFVFLFIAIVWLEFFWYDDLQRQATHHEWEAIDAIILATEIHYDSAYAEYQLSGKFAINPLGNSGETFEKFLNTGKKGHVERIAARDFPVGQTITVFRNPSNPSEFDLGRERSAGPWVIGFLPGVAIGLVGLSTLRSRLSRDQK